MGTTEGVINRGRCRGRQGQGHRDHYRGHVGRDQGRRGRDRVGRRVGVRPVGGRDDVARNDHGRGAQKFGANGGWGRRGAGAVRRGSDRGVRCASRERIDRGAAVAARRKAGAAGAGCRAGVAAAVRSSSGNIVRDNNTTSYIGRRAAANNSGDNRGAAPRIRHYSRGSRS
jgi:hypothetical protein